MAGQRENQELNFTRCIKCGTSVATVKVPSKRLVHAEDGNHHWVEWDPATEAAPRVKFTITGERAEIEAEVADAFKSIQHLRPSHRTVSMWKDLDAALQSVRQIEFLLGLLPEKPRQDTNRDTIADVGIHLMDVRASIGMLALAIAEDA